MASTKILKCSTDDIPILAAMNKRLIEDEGSTNPMNPEELAGRMRGFISGEYNAYFFTVDETPVGYALVRHTSSPLYLRQFYIDRQYRRKHYGKQAFYLLMETLQVNEIDVDVLMNNEPGRRFWSSLGFEENYVSMRYKSGK